MDRVRGQFLARAAFAFDQDIGRRGRHLFDRVENFAQGGRFAPDVFQAVALIDLLAQRAIFLLQFAALQRARDQHFHLVEIERFRDKIIGAALHRLDRGIDRSVGRHHDADGRMRHFEGAFDQGHAIFAPQPQIGQEKIDLLALQHIDRAGDVGRDVDIVIILEQTTQPVARMLFVIDNQDGRLNRIHFGRVGRQVCHLFSLNRPISQ